MSYNDFYYYIQIFVYKIFIFVQISYNFYYYYYYLIKDIGLSNKVKKYIYFLFILFI